MLDSRPGSPGQLASIWLLAVDGNPFAMRIAGGTYDGNGSFAIEGTVPPGLAGIDLDLIAFGIDGSGRLRRSAVTNVEFR